MNPYKIRITVVKNTFNTEFVEALFGWIYLGLLIAIAQAHLL